VIPWGKEVRDDGAIETARAVDDVGGLLMAVMASGVAGTCGSSLGFFDDVFGHRLAIEFVFTFKSGVVFGLEVDVTRLEGDGNGGAFKLDTKK